MMAVTRYVVKHPWISIALILLLTLFFAYNLKNIQRDPDITSSLPQNIPAKQLYDRMNDLFPSRDFVLAAVESDSLFSIETINLIYKMSEYLSDLPDVYSVMSPTNLKIIRGTEDGMEVKPILEEPLADSNELQKYKQALFNSDLPIENIISKDRRMAGIMIFLKNTVKPEDAAKQIKDYIESLKTRDKLYLTGKPVLTLYLGRGMARDMGLLFPMVLLLIMVILLLTFRNVRGVLLPLSVVIISVLWTLGLMAMLGVPISHSTNMLPILLASIAVADGIHILNHYHNEAGKAQNSIQAITNVMSELNAPVIMTSVTTAIGFLSLNVSDIGSVGELGIFTSAGVIFAMIFSLTFIPAALSLMKIPKRIHKSEKQSWFNLLALRYADFIIQRRKFVLAIILTIVILSILGIPKIVLENNSISNFPKDHPARIDYEHINKHFAGTTFLTVMVEGDSTGAIKEPAVLRDMDNLKTFLKKQPHVGGALSLADYIKRMNKVMHADSAEYDRIPPEIVTQVGYEWVQEKGKWLEKAVKFKVPGRELIAQYLQLYEMSGKPDDFANLVDYSYKNARLNAFIDTESSNALRDLDNKTRGYLKKNFKSAAVELTGTSELFLAINDLVVKGQFYSILVSMLLVVLVTAVLFRRFGDGLLNVIPLLFAMLFNFGFMGWSNIHLNIVTMLTSSIAIGVGVDYAVHFIHRYRLERKTMDVEKSVAAALHDAGVPIVLNAVTVGLGFAILTFSIFAGVEQMGLLIAIAMFTSCFGAIAILPVLFLFFGNKKEN